MQNAVEVLVIEAQLVDQRAVGLAQVLTGELIRAAKGHGQKVFLLDALALHIDVFKKLSHQVVGQHLVVKDFDRDFHGFAATHAFIQRQIHQLEVITALGRNAVGAPVDGFSAFFIRGMCLEHWM